MKLFIFVVLFFLSSSVQSQNEINGATPARCLLPEYPPEQKAICAGAFKRYRYDDKSKLCVKFTYGGCGGTENRFHSMRECVAACGALNDLSPPARCLHPMETGRCFAAFQEFYFDKKTGKCKEFTYGGCGGNENRFGTMFECKATCEIEH